MPLGASIIIPTFNRRELLRQTLASLERQSVPPSRYEVVVAVDGSTDGTTEMLAGACPAYPLRWIWQENRGCAAALNAAARLAQHDVLIVIGDDQIASHELVAAHLAAQERHGDVLVQGLFPLAAEYRRRGASLVYEQSLLRELSALPVDRPVKLHIWGMVSVRRATWERVGGCDESFRPYGGEDTDLGLRVSALGVPCIFEPRALSYHLHALGYRSFRRQEFHKGRALVRVTSKHGLPLQAFPGGALKGCPDAILASAWRRWPRAMDAIGWVFSAALWAADLVRLQPAQVLVARIIRRLYRVGGIATETASLGLFPSSGRSDKEPLSV